MLGVDPGTVVTGWGVVEECGRTVRYIASGALRLHGTRAERLGVICRTLGEICERFTPAAVVVEKTFVGENVQSAFRLGEARGAVMVAAAARELPVAEYSPAEIKMAVTGNGRAEKRQMQAMVGQVLGRSEPMVADEADALAAAICHLHAYRMAALTAQAVEPPLGGARAGRRASVGRR